MHQRLGLILAALPLALLTACGSGDDAPPPPPEPEPIAQCPTGTVAPIGGLSVDTANRVVRYTTAGNWLVSVRTDTIRIEDPSRRNALEYWGTVAATGANAGNHENLNGKHIKDRFGAVRSLQLPGGVLVTMTATGEYDGLVRISFYEGAYSHQVELPTQTVLHSCAIQAEGEALEAAEADGETASLAQTAGGGVTYDNVHTQAAPVDGVVQPKVPNAQPLGTTGGTANPNQINDYFDDPRLSYT